MFRRCRARGFRASSLGPVYHPDRASPLPYLRGEACGLAGSAQPGPQLSPPSQLPTLESQAEWSGGPLETLERVTVRGEGNTWPGANLLCTLSLTQSLTQSLLHAPIPPSSLTCSSFILQLTDSVLHTFFFPEHAPVFRHVSLLPSPSSQQLSNSSSPPQTLHA